MAESFGPYTLVSLLGEGGMARVYLAVKRGGMGFEKEVALKRIDNRLTEDQRFVRALINEARLGGQLKHKNVVEVYDFTQVGADWCLEMEFVDGWCLDALIRNCRNANKEIPPGVVLQISIEICRGLQYAHHLRSKDGTPMNLVHRDLKPGNVIVSKDGDAKIMDFGIAKADSNLYKTTAADITKGTPIYMSPEQVTGAAKLSGRSDLFSMGSIVHEMLCLDVIFHGDNLLAIMHKVLQADIRDALKSAKEKVPGLEKIIAKAMTKKPEDRYESAGAMERDLQALLDSMGPQPSIYEWLEEYQTWIPKSTPQPVDAVTGQAPAGTESLGGMTESEAGLGSFTQDFFAQGDLDTAATPNITPTQQPPSAGGGGAEQAMGELTKQFFQTDAGPAVQQRPGGPDQLSPMAATPTPPPVMAPQMTSQPAQDATVSADYPVRKKSKAGLIIGLLILVVVLLGGAVGAVVAWQMFGPGSEGNGPITIPTDPITPEPITDDGLVDATPEPITVEPRTPEPRTPEPRTPEPRTPEPRTPEPRTPEPKTPEPATEAPTYGKGVTEPTTPEDTTPAAGGDAYMTINAKPWATIYLDGVLVGNTPKKRYTVSAGSHTVVLKCGPCTEPQERTLNFSVNAGETYTNVRNEFQQ